MIDTNSFILGLLLLITFSVHATADEEREAHGLPANAIEKITATRATQNPLITSASSETLGRNINGPSVIRVPDWVEQPLGRYYLYFAHHSGKHIRLAYADDPLGPWTVHEPGTLHLEAAPLFKGHIASPDVHVDHAGKQILMYVHGPARERKGQWTGLATSRDGLAFSMGQEILGKFYFRVWQWEGHWYAIAKDWNSGWGELYRSADDRGAFESAGHFLRRLRHAAVMRRGHHLLIFYSRKGDAPERLLVATMDLRPDWKQWQPSQPLEVLRPVAEYEGIQYPNKPSSSGSAIQVRQLRDPCIFEEDGNVYLYYTYAGETGIAVAELDIRMRR